MTNFMSQFIPSKETVRQRCTSIKAWELPKQDSALAPDYVYTNKDMDPVPPEDQTWVRILTPMTPPKTERLGRR